MRSTSDWAALLDGAMDGPWEYREEPYCPDRQAEDMADAHGLSTDHITYACGCEEDATCQVQRQVVGNPHGIVADNPAYFEGPDTGTMKLIAAAPEAVAEVIRLREELDELRAETQRGVEAYRGNTASLYLKQQHRHITRILNGDSNA